MSYTNTLTQSHSILLYAIAIEVLIDEASAIFTAIDSAASGRRTTILPFGSVITRTYVVDASAVEDMEANTAEAGGAVPNEDYLVNQMPSQYCRDFTPPHLFYSNPGVSSSSAPSSITRRDLEEYLQRLWMDFFIPVL
ncbi:hypothetical protein F0562_001238 [Nyssa sinensis]|uniref:Uncharacterized protein n=1 Tax=Nyssa sinensis TaxID=561372 RepID=A0A5J5C4I4_9ASTE|nr:hypothetical protein F0562_001238 [Nyssa sinensis]